MMDKENLIFSTDTIKTPFFEVLVLGNFSPENIAICDTKAPLSLPAQLGEVIEKNWENKSNVAQQRGVTLKNNPKVSLLDCKATGKNLALELGRTDYKTFIGTVDDPKVQTDYPKFIPRLLSVASVLESSDGYFIINRRKGVSRYPDWFGAFGGDSEITDIDKNGIINPSVTTIRELSEETKIPTENIEIVKCLGLMHVVSTGVKVLMFHSKTNLIREDIEQRQRKESLQEGPSVFIPIEKESVSKMILRPSKIFVSDGLATLSLLGNECFGEMWFQYILRRLNRRGDIYNKLTEEQRKTLEQRIVTEFQ